MLADVAAQLLALLRREPARTPLLLLAPLLAALEFLIPPEFALALEIPLLWPLEAPRLIASRRLCMSRQARSDRHEYARDECQVIHSVILSSRRRLRLAYSEAAFRIMRFPMRADKHGFHCPP